MNYQEFKERLIADVETQIKEQKLDVKLIQQEVRKNNDVLLDGLMLKGDSDIAPTIYLNDLYKKGYQEGKPMEGLVSEVLECMQDSVIQQMSGVAQQLHWDTLKNKVIFQVIGAEGNPDAYKRIPARKEQDMLLTYRILLDASKDVMASFQVDQTMHERLGVSEEELYQAAIRNMPELVPPMLQNMETMLDEILSDTPSQVISLDDSLQKLEKGGMMYVLTNPQKMYGAANVFYPDVMDKIAQAFDNDMIVLPSSIHEVILLPYDKSMQIQELKNMVEEINANQVAPQDRLTNQVYIYDKEEKQLMIADKWQEQKLEKGRKPRQSMKDALKVTAGTPNKKSLDATMENQNPKRKMQKQAKRMKR